MASVNFFAADISFNLSNQKETASWIRRVIKKESYKVKEINYVFCSDEYLLQLNQVHLNHNTLTDVITFDNSEGNIELEGEIYISIERIRENAIIFKNTFRDELDRVLIHGVLHLMGHEDKKLAEKTQMRKKEEACLSLRK